MALLLVGLIGCTATSTSSPAVEPLEPPIIEFAGLVSDVRVAGGAVEFTDPAGRVRAIDLGDYRQIGEHPCCGELLILGSDAAGRFMASFLPQGGLPEDCDVENDPGVDRGASVEILGILWRKAPGFVATVPSGAPYPAGTRFCFDATGRIGGTVPP